MSQLIIIYENSLLYVTVNQTGYYYILYNSPLNKQDIIIIKLYDSPLNKRDIIILSTG